MCHASHLVLRVNMAKLMLVPVVITREVISSCMSVNALLSAEVSAQVSAWGEGCSQEEAVE